MMIKIIITLILYRTPSIQFLHYYTVCQKSISHFRGNYGIHQLNQEFLILNGSFKFFASKRAYCRRSFHARVAAALKTRSLRQCGNHKLEAINKVLKEILQAPSLSLGGEFILKEKTSSQTRISSVGQESDNLTEFFLKSRL